MAVLLKKAKGTKNSVTEHKIKLEDKKKYLEAHWLQHKTNYLEKYNTKVDSLK